MSQTQVFASRTLRLAATLALVSACVEAGDDRPQHEDNVLDGALPSDAAAVDASDGAAQTELDGSAPDAQPLPDGAASPDASEDACAGDGCGAGDPLAPYELDCANLPSNGACQGGPREVLLVTEERGLVAMFDPTDGHFLGYFKRPAASFYASGVSAYRQATQGPDQCIWTVSEDERAEVQRFDTDGSYRDAPLAPHSFPTPVGADQAVQDPVAIAFSDERLFVAARGGEPHPRLTRWKLDGSFDAVVLDDGSDARSMLPLRDGSLLISDQNQRRVARIAPGTHEATPVLGGLAVPGQIWYAGAGQLLVSDNSSSEPLYQVAIETGVATAVTAEVDHITHHEGIAKLKNGKWLIAGGDHYVSVVDPTGSGGIGKTERVWDDNAVDSVTFHNIGRACLPESFVNSRASRPADNSCSAPPAGAVIFEENFESNQAFEGTGKARHYRALYDHGTPGVSSSIDTTGGYGGSRALRIAGAGALSLPGGRSRVHKSGMYASFAAAKPSYVRYRVRAGADYQGSVGYFALQNAAANQDQYERLAGTTFNRGYLVALEANASTYPQAVDGRWLTIELRNIDWNQRTYDLYLDCQRLAEGVALPAGYGAAMDLLDLYNSASSPTTDTVAWYDDIVIK